MYIYICMYIYINTCVYVFIYMYLYIHIWQWLKIRVPNDPQEWLYLVGNHLFGVSIILSHIHMEMSLLDGKTRPTTMVQW